MTHMVPASMSEDDTVIQTVGGSVQAIGKADIGLAQGALIVPSQHVNLLSVHRILENPSFKAVMFTADGAYIVPSSSGDDERPPFPIGRVKDGQYIADNKGSRLGIPSSASAYPAIAAGPDIQPDPKSARQPSLALLSRHKKIKYWHNRLFHPSWERMAHLIKLDQLPGISLADLRSLKQTGWECEACIFGKPCRSRKKKGKRTRSTHIGQLIHCDIFGPTRTPSVQSGYRYWITFVDDHSRRLWLYLLVERKHAVEAFKQFVSDFTAATRGRKALYYSMENYVPFIDSVRTDNAGEFVGAKSQFATFLRTAGIAHEFSAPHVHQQNGVAERVNLSI